MFKKLTQNGLLIVASLLAFTACGGGNNQPADTAPTTQTEQASETATNEVAEPAETGTADTDQAVNVDKSEQLTIYSNSLSDGRQEWIEAKAKEEGFNLQFVSLGGGEVLDRLRAEKNDPQADLYFGSDEGGSTILKDEGILVEFTPAWADKIPAEAQIGEGYFWPLVEQRIVLAYNPEFRDAADAPKSWLDLGNDEKFNGKYRAPGSLGGGTNQKAIISQLLQFRDDAGEHGISDEGWEQIKKFYENAYVPKEGEDDLALYKDGTIDVNYRFSSGIGSAEDEFDFTMEPIDSPFGTFTMREQIGIVNKNKDDYSTAQAFIDWFGSADVQREWAKEFNAYPVNVDAQDGANDRIKQIAEATHPMDIDWEFINEHIDDWIEKVELEIIPF